MTPNRGSRFIVVWAGQLFSGLGTGMTSFALGVHVFNRTGSATGFAMVILALFLPSILLRPLGGVLADRVDRRSLIIFGDIGSAAAVVFMLLTLHQEAWSLPLIYAGVAVNSAFGALQNPAYKATVTDMVPPERFSKAAGLLQLSSAVQHLLAPVAAALLLTTAGLEAVLLVDVASFFLAVAAVLTIGQEVTPRQSARERRLLTELRAGANALLTDRRTLDTVLVISLVTFFVGLVQTLFAPMLLSFTGSRTLGAVQSISALGMLTSSLLLGLFDLPVAARNVLAWGVALAGGFLILMSLSTKVVWITLFFFLFFFCLPVINTSADLQIRGSIPNELQGRAWGIIGLFSQVGYLVAYLTGGFLADLLFNPLLLPQGALAESAGRVFGVGPGRGIALMLALSGLGLTLTALAKLYRDRRSPAVTRQKGVQQS
jgi:MFS family permease